MSPDPRSGTASFTSRTVSGIPVIDVTGRLTLGQPVERLRAAVRSALIDGVKTLILNLDALEYIDSAGIGELVATVRFVTASGASLKLVRLPRRIHDLLRLTAVLPLFEIRPDEASAL